MRISETFIHTLCHDDVRKLIDDGEGVSWFRSGRNGGTGNKTKNPFAGGVGVMILVRKERGRGKKMFTVR